MAIYADDAARRQGVAGRKERCQLWLTNERTKFVPSGIKNAVRHVSNLVSLSFVHLPEWNGATTSSGSFCRTAIIYSRAFCFRPLFPASQRGQENRTWRLSMSMSGGRSVCECEPAPKCMAHTTQTHIRHPALLGQVSFSLPPSRSFGWCRPGNVPATCTSRCANGVSEERESLTCKNLQKLWNNLN